MKVTSWPRALTGKELVVITSWDLLSGKEPELGQLCQYWTIAEHWSDGPHYGVWKRIINIPENIGFAYPCMFVTNLGFLCTDHKKTWWRPVYKTHDRTATFPLNVK